MNTECWVSVLTYADLLNDEVARRTYEVGRTTEAETGYESITYRTYIGQVKVVQNPLVKGGEAFVLPMTPEMFYKVGSTELGSQIPGSPMKDLVFQSQTQSVVHHLMHQNWSVFTEHPGLCTKITGIVNVASYG
jgi:hypothetical protein